MEFEGCKDCKFNGKCEFQWQDKQCPALLENDHFSMWLWFSKNAERYGWKLTNIQSKKAIDKKLQGHKRMEFDGRYEPYLKNKDICLTIYRGGTVYYDTGELDFVPMLLDTNVSYISLIEIMKVLKEMNDRSKQ